MPANLSSSESDRIYPFLREIAEMRRRARQHMQAGSIAAGETAAPPTVLRLLQEALAKELICVSRYRRHSAMSGMAVAQSVRDEFFKYAQEQQSHVELLARRIAQLGGEPNLTVQQAPVVTDLEGVEAEALADILEEALIAEQIAIGSYREIVQYLGASDPLTRELLDAILAANSRMPRSWPKCAPTFCTAIASPAGRRLAVCCSWNCNDARGGCAPNAPGSPKPPRAPRLIGRVLPRQRRGALPVTWMVRGGTPLRVCGSMADPTLVAAMRQPGDRHLLRARARGFGLEPNP
ncbi:MAG TPA: ferritin-like domain-containing protein [Steroidobacteraceae bacterium]|nr:ferritin-like domain-containing protein [Steroidobacteraceae bacterium]